MADTDTTPTDPLKTGPEEGSLEDSSTIVEDGQSQTGAPEPALSSVASPLPDENSVLEEDATGGASAPRPAPKPKAGWWRRLTGRLNVYLLLFIFIVIVAISIVAAAYFSSQHESSGISSQKLSPGALQQLADSGTPIGSPDQILNVRSSTVFSGRVLMRQGLEVAGNLQIGGTLALNSLSVAGTAQFGQLQVNKDLSVAGNTGLQGTLTVAKSLQVSGGGNFGGALSAPQLTTSRLQLNGDLVLTHHVSAGGATPGRTNGGALGGGGTSSVSGSDTAGSITVNTGSGPAAGCFVTVNFTSRYNATPHILITPVGSAAAGLNYYINRSASNFSVCTTTPAPAGASFGFDYFVID